MLWCKDVNESFQTIKMKEFLSCQIHGGSVLRKNLSVIKGKDIIDLNGIQTCHIG